MSSPIQQLADFGQSVWLDYIDRPLLESGKLQKLIDLGLRGMTSNPSIFNNAIGNTHDYDAKIIALKNAGKTTFEIYDELTIKDIQEAADILKSVYTETKGLDGYVSLEINPQLASLVGEQMNEGLRLWKKVARPNVMIKVPATPQGLKVVEELISQGINVNTTLIFSQKQYEDTAHAYLRGLERRVAKGGDIRSIHSVASFFISRIDTAVDKLLDEKMADASAAKYKGRAAVANSRVAYEKFDEIFEGAAFGALKAKGANEQRLLWASTSTKNPQYQDIKYVTELITAPTVNTLPAPTLDAFLDHGKVKEAFTYPSEDAQAVLTGLKNFGIDIDAVCRQLLQEGVESFDRAFDQLFESIEKKSELLVKK